MADGDISTQAQSLDGVTDRLVEHALSELDGSDFESVRDHSATLRATITRLTAENAAQAAEIERLLDELRALNLAVTNHTINNSDDYALFNGDSEYDVSGVVDIKIDAARALTGGQHG